MQFLLEMGPDLTQPEHIFDLQQVKRPTRLWPRYFLTRPNKIFFGSEGKKLKNLVFLVEVFQSQTQTKNGWPDPAWGPKNSPPPNFDPNPSLVLIL